MASPNDTISMALFCDFENVAIGVRDANYQKFDIKRVLERLLLKGSIVVKKAYCDWDRYKQFKGTMHEANFELIEIPHVRQSGKNSADIRLVVDALDLCYTKSHVNTFVIISGDSDFSPLVSKLRENAKQVIGVGVKQSTSDLLIANCDEFIFYDDLVREGERQASERQARRGTGEASSSPRPSRPVAEDPRRREEAEARKHRALDLVVSTLEALLAERGEGGRVRASLLKDAIKRRKPDFSENRYGFKTFGALIEEAQSCGLVDIERDEKSNVYLFRSTARSVPRAEATAPAQSPAQSPVQAPRASRGRRHEAAPPAMPTQPPAPQEEHDEEFEAFAMSLMSPRPVHDADDGEPFEAPQELPAQEPVEAKHRRAEPAAQEVETAEDDAAAGEAASGPATKRPARTSRGGRGRGTRRDDAVTEAQAPTSAHGGEETEAPPEAVASDAPAADAAPDTASDAKPAKKAAAKRPRRPRAPRKTPAAA